VSLVSIIASIVYFALGIFLTAMWGRFILDLARNFARQWRQRGFVLVVAEAVFTITDPPLRAIRGVIKPVRVGAISLDFGWSIVLLACIIVMSIVQGFI
jgi:YggT family protein